MFFKAHPPRRRPNHRLARQSQQAGSQKFEKPYSPRSRPSMKYSTTPDGRYFVHQERLWRCTNPNLDEETRRRLVGELMAARRDVGTAKRAGDDAALAEAREKVHAAKVALGERGPTWWDDDTDFNRCLVKNTPYADWWTSLGATDS